jgi:uncharacterized RDD family membrane protein YckC
MTFYEFVNHESFDFNGRLIMKCPECGYISFDHLEICQKCGAQLYKNPDSNLHFSHEDNNTSGESSLKYPQSKPSSHKKPPEKIIEKDSMGFYDTSKESNERGENSPANPFLFHGFEKDDAALSENPLLSSDATEGIQTNKIKSDINKSKGGFWIRSLAFIIDLIFINILITIFTWSIKLGVITGARIMIMKPENFLDLREFLITSIGVAILAFYFIYFHGKTGQTPGKSLLHLKVIRTDGSPLGFDKAIERFFCYIISLLPLYAGFLLIAFNKEKQGLHDIIIHTYVIKTGR